jgi:hypothetical protein
VAAAVSGREVAADVPGAGGTPGGVLCDQGFDGDGFAASRASRGTAVLVPPTRAAWAWPC